jgi:hypothetical protein
MDDDQPMVAEMGRGEGDWRCRFAAKHIGQNGVRFVTRAKSRQQEAVQFLWQRVQTPSFMIRPKSCEGFSRRDHRPRAPAQGGIIGQLLGGGSAAWPSSTLDGRRWRIRRWNS